MRWLVERREGEEMKIDLSTSKRLFKVRIREP